MLTIVPVNLTQEEYGMPQTRKLVGALGVVLGLAVLAFAITAGGAHQAYGQTPATTGTSAAGTPSGGTTGTTAAGTPAAGTTGTPAAAGTSITTTGTRTATTGSPTAGAAAGASTLPSSGTGDGGSSSSMIWMIAAGALVALFGAGMLTSGIFKRR